MASFTSVLPLTPIPISPKPKPYLASTRVPPLTIECSSRPQKKATAHHVKSRPKKTALWDKKRGPAVYEPLPPLPPDWTLVSSGEDTSPATAAVAAAVEG